MASVLTLPPLFYVVVDGSYFKIQIGQNREPPDLAFWCWLLKCYQALTLGSRIRKLKGRSCNLFEVITSAKYIYVTI